jgi:Protein of unknown function (DUF3060)
MLKETRPMKNTITACLIAAAVIATPVAWAKTKKPVGTVGSTNVDNGIGNVGSSRCKAGTANVTGTGNVFYISGYCNNVVVGGTGNVIDVDRAGKITVTGTGNVVRYRYLNEDVKRKGKFVHPVKSASGMTNAIMWTEGKPFEDWTAGDSSDD